VYCPPATDDRVLRHARHHSNFPIGRAPVRRRPTNDVAPTAITTSPTCYRHSASSASAATGIDPTATNVNSDELSMFQGTALHDNDDRTHRHLANRAFAVAAPSSLNSLTMFVTPKVIAIFLIQT